MKNVLQQSLDRVNQKYFCFEQVPIIRFSRGRFKDNRRTIVFGTYHIQRNEIKIHPILETAPEIALDFVVYHEMLHFQDKVSLSKRKKGDGVHTPEFRRREQEFLGYEDAQKILKDLLHGKTNMQQKILRGEALEEALANSLQRLDHVLSKYNFNEETKKGAKRGSKKRNDQVELDSND